MSADMGVRTATGDGDGDANDWLDRLYEDDAAWSGEEDPAPVAVLVEKDDEDQADDGADTDAEDRWLRPEAGYYEPVLGAVADRVPLRPALSDGTRRLLYSASAAGAGWLLGLEPLMSRAICSCGREASIGAALVLGTGMALFIAHAWDRRTRHWWWGLAWAARIPLASAVTALALYAPASQF